MPQEVQSAPNLAGTSQQVQSTSFQVETPQQVQVAPIIDQTCKEPNADTTTENSAFIPSKRVRGPTRGIGLEKLIKGKNKLQIDIPVGKGRPVCEVQSAKLSFEIGVITRQFIPVPTKWKALKDEEKFHAFERLNRRCETNARVRNNVKLTHNQGSRAFVASRYAMRKDDQEPNRMEFFKATHYSEKKGWSTPEAQSAYEEMVELQSSPVEEGVEPKTIDAIVDEVLGTRSGYIKGLGYGPKPSSSKSKASTAHLEKRLQKTQDELQQYKSTFELFQSQFQAMANALIAAGIQVPLPQFSALSGATNSLSIQSPSTQDLD